MEVARRRGRRRKKLLDDLKDRRGYSHLKEEALDRTIWVRRFGGGFGPVVRQNTEWMNAPQYSKERFSFEGSQVSTAWPSDWNSAKIKMSMERYWNVTDHGIPKYSEKNVPFPLLPPQIAHDWSGEEPVSPPCEPSKYICYIEKWCSYLIEDTFFFH